MNENRLVIAPRSGEIFKQSVNDKLDYHFVYSYFWDKPIVLSTWVISPDFGPPVIGLITEQEINIDAVYISSFLHKKMSITSAKIHTPTAGTFVVENTCETINGLVSTHYFILEVK